MAGDDEVSSLDDWGPPEDTDWAPVHFLVPPPPPPPSLSSVCTSGDFYCRLEGGPMGAHFNRASFPSLPIIAVCSSVVLVAVLVASFLLWRHKTKVQNLLPCKHDQQAHLGELAAPNGVTYEDVLINHHPTRIPQTHLAGSQNLMPLELLDVKLGDVGPQVSPLHRPPYFPSREATQLMVGKPYNPVYEEVSQAPSGDKSTTGKSYESDFEESGKLGGRSLTSEDDFAEDEFSVAGYPSGEGSGQCSATSSVRGSTGGDLYKDPASSDEGTAEECDYRVNNLSDMMPGDNAFNYSRKPLGMHVPGGDRPDKSRGNPTQVPHGHQHDATYPLDNLPSAPTQRMLNPTLGDKLHSKSDAKRNTVSPSHVPPANPNLASYPSNAQWLITKPDHENKMNFSPSSSSQENIYSTIDEDEPSDYQTHPSSLTSLACPPRGCAQPQTKRSSAVPKNVQATRGDRSAPLLSQRNVDDTGSSYGDIMPAFNPASYT